MPRICVLVLFRSVAGSASDRRSAVYVPVGIWYLLFLSFLFALSSAKEATPSLSSLPPLTHHTTKIEIALTHCFLPPLVWGIAGAILSVPLVAVLRVLVIKVDHDYARYAPNLSCLSIF